MVDDKIFGYDWEEIRRAQQGGRLGVAVVSTSPKPCATEADITLLATEGEQWLRLHKYDGVLDRLKNSGIREENLMVVGHATK